MSVVVVFGVVVVGPNMTLLDVDASLCTLTDVVPSALMN